VTPGRIQKVLLYCTLDVRRRKRRTRDSEVVDGWRSQPTAGSENVYVAFLVLYDIISDSQLSKCTKTRLKWHKISHKRSKHREAYDAPQPPSPLVGQDKLPQSLYVQCSSVKKINFLDRLCIRHDASANNSNSTRSNIVQNNAIFL